MLYSTTFSEKTTNAILLRLRDLIVEQNCLIDRSGKMVTVSNERLQGLPELFLLLDRIRFKSWYLPATQYKLAKAHVNVQFSCPELASLDAG